MTGYTTNYTIPYPTGTDDPCSLSDNLVAAAEVIGAALAALDVTVGYMFEPPAVRVSRSTAATVLNGAEVPFTSVDFDRYGVADLAADDISVPFATIPGIYLRGGDFVCTGTGTPGTEFTVSLTPTSLTSTSDQSARDSGTLAASGTAILDDPGTAVPMTEKISVSIAVASSSVTSASMWAIRMSGTI